MAQNALKVAPRWPKKGPRCLEHPHNENGKTVRTTQDHEYDLRSSQSCPHGVGNDFSDEAALHVSVCVCVSRDMHNKRKFVSLGMFVYMLGCHATLMSIHMHAHMFMRGFQHGDLMSCARDEMTLWLQ